MVLLTSALGRPVELMQLIKKALRVRGFSLPLLAFLFCYSLAAFSQAFLLLSSFNEDGLI